VSSELREMADAIVALGEDEEGRNPHAHVGNRRK
jgi:hypothetical protein